MQNTHTIMVGTLLNERYRIDAELGRGGMGAVYRAYDTLLDRAVAVKVLSDPRLGTEGRARLLREAQAVAKLDHVNIVAVYDAGESNGSPFIVMQLVEGKSLHERRPQGIDEIVSVAKQLCAALYHAHSLGIVHRDLKPENVVVTSDGTLKLMDFGLARSIASRLSSDGTIVGTVFYMAPEQALGQDVDGRVDLYALGVILYELTTGRLPFSADDPVAVISQHLHAPVVPPRAHNEAIPPALDALIVRLMSKRPEDRPASANAVLLELERFGSADDEVAVPAGLSVLDSIVRGSLVGRSAELDGLRKHWMQAQSGHGHLVLVSGEPGVGKTRLADELIAYVRLKGGLVLQGGCYEYEATTPYLPLAEALRDWAHAQPDDVLRRRAGSSAAELAKLAPEIEARLAPLTPNPPLTPDEERLRLFDHVARFLGALASEQGLLLFVDDLHWADHGTLSLVHYLLRRLRGERMLVLGAYRELELDRRHPLASALVDWNRERLASRVQLDRLTRDECGALLVALLGQESVSADLAQAIYRETDGNPFFVEEVVKSLVERGHIYRQDGGWGYEDVADLAVPQSIKEAIGRRLDRLSGESVQVLQHAAVLGKTFDFAELAAAFEWADQASHRADDQLLDALDEALGAQLIRAGIGETFIFTHDKIREVLYDELNPIRRRRLHQSAGAGLERLYTGQVMEAHIQDLAYHYLQSGDLERGLDYARRAAQHAERLYAYDEALVYYQQAVECAQALDQSDQVAELSIAIGDTLANRGLIFQAVDRYQNALALISSPEVRAAVKTKIGAAYGKVGDERGLEYLRAAHDELDPTRQPNEMAHNLTTLGRYHHYRSQHWQAITYLERARELAEPLDDASTLTYLYGYLAGAYQHLARFDESLAWAHRCLALGERQAYPPATAIAYEFLAEDFNLVGRWQDALDYALRDREIGEKIGSLDRVGWAEYARSSALYELGNLQEARDTAISGLELAEHIGDGRLVIWLAGQLGFIETDLGEDETARGHAGTALSRADELGQVILQGWSRAALAYWHIQHSEWGEALELARQGVVLYEPTENRLAPLFLGAVKAESFWGAGRLDEASQEIAAYLSLARQSGSPHYVAVGLRVQGQILAAQERWDEAAQVFDTAIARLDELGSRLGLGRAMYQRGLLRKALGQTDAAHADATHACKIFGSCNAVRDMEKARSFLGTPDIP